MTNVQEQILRACLALTTGGVWITLLLAVGYLLCNKKIFGQAFYLLLFTMVYNTYLKSLWQIPLPPALGSSGWAFPSGHMHTAVVLWGSLAYQYANPYLWAVVLALALGSGYALIALGYHYPVDILGATLFGLLSLWIYFSLLSIEYLKLRLPKIGLCLAVLGYFLAIHLPSESKQMHVWLSLGGLLGFSLGWILAEKWQLKCPSSWPGRCLTLLILGTGLAALEMIFLKFSLPGFFRLYHFVRFFTMAIWISIGVPFAMHAYKKWRLSICRRQ